MFISACEPVAKQKPKCDSVLKLYFFEFSLAKASNASDLVYCQSAMQ